MSAMGVLDSEIQTTEVEDKHDEEAEAGQKATSGGERMDKQR